MTPRDAAKAYADLGWPVFPIKPGDKRPDTKNGLLDATRDPARIEQWWDENPARNVAIVTSRASGIWVLDEDVDHETGELIGEMTLAELEAKHGPLPPHPVARTPRGGRHHVFAYPDDGLDLPRRIKFAPGLDALGSRTDDGEERAGYFVAYPSAIGDGRYKWDTLPSKVAPPQAPAWLLAAVRAEPADQPIEVSRSDTTTPWGRVALEEECDLLARTPPGAQDDTLVKVASKIGSRVAGGYIEENEAFTTLVDAGMRMLNGGRPWTRREIEAKVKRGFKYGAKRPYKKRDLERPVPQMVVNNQLAPDKAAPSHDDWMMNLPWQVRKKEEPGLRHNLKPQDAINCQLMIERHPELSGIYIYNRFSDQIIVTRGLNGETNGYPRQLSDADEAALCGWLNWHWIAPSLTMVRAYVRYVAFQHSFDPLDDYLRSLKWDGKPRIDKWLTYYADAPDTEYTRLIGRKFLISAAARGLRPGCKVDTMLICEGEQSIGKSTMPYTLFGAPYFSDQVGDVRNKDAAERIQGCWCVEIPEMDKFSRVEANAVKSFLSQRDDRYRAAYAHNTATRLRRCVFFGTINPDGSGYLRDTTGNRRFWPVLVRNIDIPALAIDRDQIWAEAIVALDAGEEWWLTREEEKITIPEQAAREQEMVLEPRIADWLSRQTVNHKGTIEFTMFDCLQGIGINPERMDTFGNKVGPVLRRLKCVHRNNKGKFWEFVPT